jgi:hypothetical protein
MSEYLEVVQFKKQNDKWRANRLGSAKKNDKGQLIVYLDSLPIADAEGQVRLTIQKKQERQDGDYGSSLGGKQDHQAPARVELEDEIPF